MLGACVPLGPAACSLDLPEMLAASPPRPAETFLCISFEMCQIFVFAPASPHSLDVGRYQHSTVSEGAKKKKKRKKKGPTSNHRPQHIPVNEADEKNNWPFHLLAYR